MAAAGPPAAAAADSLGAQQRMQPAAGQPAAGQPAAGQPVKQQEARDRKRGRQEAPQSVDKAAAAAPRGSTAQKQGAAAAGSIQGQERGAAGGGQPAPRKRSAAEVATNSAKRLKVYSEDISLSSEDCC